MLYRRHSLHDVTIEIPVVVLREIDEIGRAGVANCHVDPRQLVETHIVVAHRTHYRHQVAQSSSQPAVHPQEIVPSVCASRHIVIVGDVSPHYEDVGVEGGSDLRQVDSSRSVARISSVDHPNGPRVVVRNGLVDSVGPKLAIVVHLREIFRISLQPCDQG